MQLCQSSHFLLSVCLVTTLLWFELMLNREGEKIEMKGTRRSEAQDLTVDTSVSMKASLTSFQPSNRPAADEQQLLNRSE